MDDFNDDFDFTDEYEVLEQNVIDQPIVNNSPTPVPSGGEQAITQPSVESPVVDNSLAEKYRSAFAAAQSPEEPDAIANAFKAELNAMQSAWPNLSMFASDAPLTDRNDDLLKSLKNGSFSVNSEMTKSFTDKVEYNLGINLGCSTADIDSVLTAWESDNGYYLQPDKFGIYRKFKNGIMDQDEAYKVSILDGAYEKAVHDAFSELQSISSPLDGGESSKKVDSNEVKISGDEGKTTQDEDAKNEAGVKTRKLQDGRIITVYPDGTRIEINPDGTRELIRQGGGETELAPDYTKIEYLRKNIEGEIVHTKNGFFIVKRYNDNSLKDSYMDSIEPGTVYLELDADNENYGRYKMVGKNDVLVPRLRYDSEIIRTKDGYFIRDNGVDKSIGQPWDIFYWDECIQNPSLGIYKYAGYPPANTTYLSHNQFEFLRQQGTAITDAALGKLIIEKLPSTFSIYKQTGPIFGPVSTIEVGIDTTSKTVVALKGVSKWLGGGISVLGTSYDIYVDYNTYGPTTKFALATAIDVGSTVVVAIGSGIAITALGATAIPIIAVAVTGGVVLYLVGVGKETLLN